jgi:hypothetical protein
VTACGEPIACSLDAASLAERADEWRALVASSVTSVRSDPAALRLTLRDSDAALTAAASLARREKQCCPFFDVSIVVEADRCTLVLAVPEGAEEVLAAFAALVCG